MPRKYTVISSKKRTSPFDALQLSCIHEKLKAMRQRSSRPVKAFAQAFDQKISVTFTCIVLALFSAQCGDVKLEKNRTSADVSPTGTLIAQGPFTAESGSGLTGIAQVYLSTDNSQYIIRIQSLVAPNETGLQLSAMANGIVAYEASLKSYQGDTNYSTGVAPAVSWNTVTIRSVPKNQNYGTALLTAQ